MISVSDEMHKYAAAAKEEKLQRNVLLTQAHKFMIPPNP